MKKTELYDYIVIGLGAFGAPSLLRLKNEGYRVLGLDARTPGADLTLSSGETRIFREGYVEDTSFIPIAKEAREKWLKIEKDFGGIISDRGHQSFFSNLEELNEYSLIFKKYNIEYEFKKRKLKNQIYEGIEEKNAFVINTKNYFNYIFSHLENKDFQFNTKVNSLEEKNSNIIIKTDKTILRTKKVILSAGQWSESLLGREKLNSHVTCQRSPVFWFENEMEIDQSFSIKNKKGHFFFVPSFDKKRVKVFNYNFICEYRDPHEHDYKISDNDRDIIFSFLINKTNFSRKNLLKEYASLYYSTPNDLFLLEKVGQQSNIHLMTGGSGHAFKFSPLFMDNSESFSLD